MLLGVRQQPGKADADGTAQWRLTQGPPALAWLWRRETVLSV